MEFLRQALFWGQWLHIHQPLVRLQEKGIFIFAGRLVMLTDKQF